MKDGCRARQRNGKKGRSVGVVMKLSRVVCQRAQVVWIQNHGCVCNIVEGSKVMGVCVSIPLYSVEVTTCIS